MPTKLTEAEIQDHLTRVPAWALVNGELSRTFELDTFPAALLWVNTVAYLAEAAAHHPHITINYRRVTLALTTHDAGGISVKDFDLAAKLDSIFG